MLASVKAEVVGKSIYPQQNYHFGPLKVLTYLKRYHDVTMSDSGVWNISKRLDMNRMPSSQRHKPDRERWKRYEKPRLGNGVQIRRIPLNASHQALLVVISCMSRT